MTSRNKTLEAQNINTIGDMLTHIRESHITQLFYDENGDPWALYKDPKPTLTGIETKAFEDWLRIIIFETKEPKEVWVAQLQKLLASLARRQRQVKLALRSKKGSDKSFFYQLNENEMLLLDKNRIERKSITPIFRVLDHQGALEIDNEAKKEDLELLDKYLPIATQTEKDLFKSLLPVYLIPEISKPGMVVTGSPKAAKSTFCQVIKQLFDPTKIRNKGGKIPKDERDWIIKCQNHAIIILDNLSYITQEQQDLICRIVTGFTHEERELYTNKGLIQSYLQGVPLINGIDFSNLKSDFLDRMLLTPLERIPAEKQIPEERFWKEFEKEAPRIRGAIIKLIQEALTYIDTIPDIHKFRLSDFARWGEAIAISRGKSAEEFRNQLEIKVKLQSDETLAQSILTEPIIRFIEEKQKWEGTATELLKQLTEQEFGVIEGYDDKEKIIIRNVPKKWFKEPQQLGAELTRIEPFIKSEGVNVKRDRTGRERKIFLEKSEKPLSHPSPNPSEQRILGEESPYPVTTHSKKVVTNSFSLSPKMTSDKGVTAEQDLVVTRENIYIPEIPQEEENSDKVTKETKKSNYSEEVYN